MLQGKRMKFRRSENILICLATAMSKKWILDYFYYFTSDISNITDLLRNAFFRKLTTLSIRLSEDDFSISQEV